VPLDSKSNTNVLSRLAY